MQLRRRVLARVFRAAVLVVFTAAVSAGRAAAGPAEDCLTESVAKQKLEICSKAIASADPNTPKSDIARLYSERSAAETVLGKPDYAIDDINKAITLDPSNATLHMSVGEIYMHLGKYDKALKYLIKAAELKAGSDTAGWALYLKSIYYSMLGRYSLAQSSLKSARQMLPDRYADYETEKAVYSSIKDKKYQTKLLESFEAGKRELSAGQLERAAAFFSESLASNPSLKEASSWLGSVYYDQGDYPRALQALLAVPEAERWNYYIAACQFRTGQYEKALASFRAAAKDGPDKNRGEDNKQEGMKVLTLLTGYFDNVKKGDKAGDQGDTAGALEAYEKARGYLETSEIKALIETQTDILNRKNSQIPGAAAEPEPESSSVLRTAAITVLVLALVILAIVKIKNGIARDRVQRWENFVARVLSLPYRDAFSLYCDYKDRNPYDAPRLARRMIEFVANSCDFELVKVFAAEFEEEDRNRFIAASAAAFIRQGGFANCIDALGLINEIPFEQWDDGAVFIFVNAHVLCDPVLFDKSSGDMRDIWAPGIMPEAYFLLARVYARRGEMGFALRVMEHLPQYSWSDPHWLLYLRSMFAAGGIAKIELNHVPDEYKIIVVEELFKAGLLKRVANHLNDLSRQRWRPEYFFYMFFISLKGKFDESWEYYNLFSESFPVGKFSRVHYMFALLCEHLGKHEKALSIYESFISAKKYYKDMNQRARMIREKKISELSSAAEQLRRILPASVFAGG
ncbi:MAG: tetratricopeptide repeat protein [Elusimicrobiaceae bacterium]|nr:tetratricopeptide repeat protein [Elusimicrobiaceae bacterium]